MLSSPRRPSRTMRILSSAEKCRRVARRMSFTTASAGSCAGPDFRLIFAPSKATMSQKSSLVQLTRSVSRSLTADTSEDFPNPILRLGRGASNYAQLLKKGAIDRLRINHRLVKQGRPDRMRALEQERRAILAGL